MKIEIVAIVSFLVFGLQFSLVAQGTGPLAKTHYIFFYAYADAENHEGSYKDVAVTKIYKDDAQTHYLFKLLNLKQRSLNEMKLKIRNHQDFKLINTDFSSTEEEAKAKMKKLIKEWEKNKTVVHQLDFKYENATGQEYPE